jgi:hypothetical protein
VRTDAGIQCLRRNVYSTNLPCHGNLPCACGWKPSDCSVVCDCGGGPMAHPRLSPEGDRAPSAARGARWPPGPSPHRFHHAAMLSSRYKGTSLRVAAPRSWIGPLTPTLSPQAGQGEESGRPTPPAAPSGRPARRRSPRGPWCRPPSAS